jgi:hypothetical protein
MCRIVYLKMAMKRIVPPRIKVAEISKESKSVRKSNKLEDQISLNLS